MPSAIPANANVTGKTVGGGSGGESFDHNATGSGNATGSQPSQPMQPSPLQRTGDNAATNVTIASGQTAVLEGERRLSNVAITDDNNNPTNTQDSNHTNSSKYENEDQLVLDYLKQKGMHHAASELMKKIESEKGTGEEGKDSETSGTKSARERFLEEDEKVRASRTLLTKTTGGGYGYDRDSVWPVVQWGIPDTEAAAVAEANTSRRSRNLGVEEARAMLDAFVHFQLWVLSLPDHHSTSNSSSTGEHYDNVLLESPVENPILRAQQAILENEDQPVAAIVKTMVSEGNSAFAHSGDVGVYNLPPSVKPELLAVSFALFVHTYADLLEVGMESTAQSLRDAFAPLYQSLFPSEFRDLCQCETTER